MGRPLKYETPEQMQKAIDLYFLACRVHQTGDPDLLDGLDDDSLEFVSDISDVHPTITGLALALDLTRQSLINYEERDEFFDTIKKAKLRIESYIEQKLFGQNVTGCIFNLKNNFGWADKQSVEHSGGLTVNLDASLTSVL